jgi:hypothetical protein
MSSKVWFVHQAPYSKEAEEAKQILSVWRSKWKGSRYLVLGIRLVDSLLRGDLSILHEYFPEIIVGTRGYSPVMRNRPGIPQIEYVEKSAEEELAEALDMGFGGMNF